MPNAVDAKPERPSSVLVHRGTRAVQRLVEYAPATGGLALWARHSNLPPRPPGKAGAARPPAVATDGHTLYYDADFEKLSLPEQAGLVAHEVLHVALRHPQRYADLKRLVGDVDLRLFNTCADAIVNSTLSHLSWLQLPPNAVTLEGLLSSALTLTPGVETALLEWDVERLYRAIDDRRQNGRDSTRPREDGPRSSRVRALGAATATDLLPASGSDDAPEAQAEQLREWSERLLRAHTSDGEFSLLRHLLADLPRTRTPWQQVLRTQLARGLAPQRELSWSRPSRSYIANQGRAGPGRRMPFEPGHSATKRVPRLVVMVDVSGSIDRDLMDSFAREIETLTRRLESKLVLVIGDDKVQKVAHYEPGKSDLRDISFNGGGGTDFTPLLEEADRHGPDIGVFLTDLDGPARFKPRWPVIWAVPQACADAMEPFGRKLVLG
jgi:predicted metal-dependent peptidase